MSDDPNVPKAKTKAHATKTIVARRIDDVMRIRLGGGGFANICEYVRKNEIVEGSAWHLAPGDSPLTDSQLWRYIGKVDQAMRDVDAEFRQRLISMHVARCGRLYYKANQAADIRLALACLQHEAKILGLYPKRGKR